LSWRGIKDEIANLQKLLLEEKTLTAGREILHKELQMLRASKATSISERDGVLAERDALLAKRTALLTMTAARVAEQNALLKVKDARFGRKEMRIAKTDVQIAKKEAMSADAVAKLARLDKQISGVGTGVQILPVRGLRPQQGKV